MPITKSAAKRMRQNIKQHRRNLHTKAMVKSQVRALQNAISSSDTKKSVTEKLASAQSKIDKAAKAGVIHKNKAARQKARLAKAVNAGAAKESKPVAKAKKTVAGKTAKTAPVKSPAKKTPS